MALIRRQRIIFTFSALSTVVPCSLSFGATSPHVVFPAPFCPARLSSYEVLANYSPRASVHPSRLDLTDCPYMWPFCLQPLYSGE